MSEASPSPDVSRFPDLTDDETWTKTFSEGTLFARVFSAGGVHPSAWWQFREYGPIDARFDPHPLPSAEHPGFGVMYAVPESGGGSDTAFAACILEVFQHHRVITRSERYPTLVLFETTRPITLVDLSDSDWLTVAGGTASISSGPRTKSREWARALHAHYPNIDGVLSASSIIPSSRIAALWSSVADAVPAHPTLLLRLDRDELTSILDQIAERYGYVIM